jgi:type IX secretion system substrate protein
MNIVKIILPIFLALFPIWLSSQDLSAELKWTQISETAGGGSFIYDVKVVADGMGNICVCGQKSIFNGVDYGFYALKYDSAGNLLWENVYNTLALDQMEDCELDGDGNLIIVGTTQYFQATTAAVVKYSPAGEEMWVFEYFQPLEFGSSIRDVIVDGEGNIILAGTEYIEGEGAYLTTFKLNPEGDIIWKNQYDETETYGFYRGKLLQDRIIVLGLKTSSSGPKYLIHQIDFAGQTIATAEIEKEDEASQYFTFDNVGNLYLGDEARQYKVAKVSPEGDTLWYYELPVVNPPTPTGVYARLTALEADEDGNVYVSGPYYEEDSGFGIVTSKLDENGELVWSRRYSHPGIETADSPRDIAVTDEHVIVVGETYQDTVNGRDYLLLIYSKNGDELLELSYDNNNNKNDVASSVAVNGNNVYLTGLTSLSGAVWDSTYLLTQRYYIDGLVSALSQQKLIPGVEIYPNPFSWNIHVDQTESNYFFERYELYSISGGLIISGFIVSKESQIDVPPALPAGIYLLKLLSSHGEEMRKVLVKGG